MGCFISATKCLIRGMASPHSYGVGRGTQGGGRGKRGGRRKGMERGEGGSKGAGLMSSIATHIKGGSRNQSLRLLLLLWLLLLLLLLFAVWGGGGGKLSTSQLPLRLNPALGLLLNSEPTCHQSMLRHQLFTAPLHWTPS